jgi:hypothetical protein
VLAGVKNVTRRNWKDGYAVGFRRGERLTALDKDRRYGGKPVAIIELTAAPKYESTARLTPADWMGEGFAYLEDNYPDASIGGRKPVDVWNDWLTNPVDVWVVRFRLIEILADADASQGRLIA